MGRMSIEEFKNKKSGGGGTSGKFIQLTKVGEVTGWVHKVGFWTRLRHGIFAVPSDDVEKQDEKKLDFLQENCAGLVCPICALKEWAGQQLKNDEDLKKVVVLSSKIDSKYDYTLEELAGFSKDWHKKVTDVTEKIFFPMIPIKEMRDSKNSIQLVEGPPSLRDRIRAMLVSKEALAVKRGQDKEKSDPTKHPWAFTCKFDDEMEAKLKYSAVAVGAEDAPMDDEAKELFESDLSEQDIDMEKLTGEGNAETIMEFLQRAWATKKVSFDEFEEFVGRKAKKFGKKVEAEEKVEKPKEDDDDEEDGPDTCQHCGKKTKLSPKGRCGQCGKVNTKKIEDEGDGIPF